MDTTSNKMQRTHRGTCRWSVVTTLVVGISLWGLAPCLYAFDVLPVDFNPRPLRERQVEWVKPDYAAAGWGAVMPTSTHIVLLAYVQAGSVSCRTQLPTACTAAERQRFFLVPSDGPHRFAYTAASHLGGIASFFLLAYNTTTGRLALSNVSEVDFSKPILSPVPSEHDYWEQYQPSPPVPLALTQADVWVDGTNGNDANDGRASNRAVRTIRRGVAVLNTLRDAQGRLGGKKMIIRGGVYRNPTPYSFSAPNVLDLLNMKGRPGNPVIIAGYGSEEVILDGFQVDYEALVRQGDPAIRQYCDSRQPGIHLSTCYERYIYGQWNGVGLGGAEDVVVENLTIRGFLMEGVNPDNTKRVWLRFLKIHNIGQWGIQAFASTTWNQTLEDFTLEGSYIAGMSNGWRSEHCVYVAALGSRVNPETGLREAIGKRIRIGFNMMAHCASHGIQVNGTHEDVLIHNNLIMQTGMAAVQSTGNSHVRIVNNVFAQTHRFPISIFTDYDGTYYPTRTGTDAANWKRDHHRVIRDIEIAYNTLHLVIQQWGPISITSPPGDMDSIRLAEGSGYETDAAGNQTEAFVEPYVNVHVHDNIVVGHKPDLLWLMQSYRRNANNQPMPIEYNRDLRMLEGLSVRNNILRTTRGGSVPMLTQFWYAWRAVSQPVSWYEQNYPANYSNNLLNADPQFTWIEPVVYLTGAQWWPDHALRLLRNDYRLRAGSPAIDRGRAPYPAIDLMGIARPRGAAADLGAHESH